MFISSQTSVGKASSTLTFASRVEMMAWRVYVKTDLKGNIRDTCREAGLDVYETASTAAKLLFKARIPLYVEPRNLQKPGHEGAQEA